MRDIHISESADLTSEDEAFLDTIRWKQWSQEEEWRRVLTARLQRELNAHDKSVYVDGIMGPGTAKGLSKRPDVRLGPQLTLIAANLPLPPPYHRE